MQRRAFLAASAATLAFPAAVRAQAATTLRFIPQIDLAFLDPHWTTAYVTRNHGYLVFDTLYGQDGAFDISPQMLAGHVVENDGRLWKLTLRDGLLWHDGERVLGRDCVASIKRWARRDAFGDALMAATDELSAPEGSEFNLLEVDTHIPRALLTTKQEVKDLLLTRGIIYVGTVDAEGEIHFDADDFAGVRQLMVISRGEV